MSDLAGYDLLRSGDYVNAIDIFYRTIMSKDSSDLMKLKKLLSTIYRGRCYFELEMYDEAIRDYCTFKNNPLSKQREFKVKGDDPGIPYNIIDEFERIDYNLGKAYFFSEEYDTAFKCFSDFIENNKNNDKIKKSYLFDSWKFKGLSALKLQNYSEAETALNDALKNANSKFADKDNQADRDIINEALYLIHLHKDFTKGRDLQKNGDYSDAINTYGSIYEEISNHRSNHSDRKETFFDDFFINHISETYRDTLMNKGICLKNMKRYDDAIEIFEAVIDYVPDQNDVANLYRELAGCCLDKNDPDRALDFLDKAKGCTDNKDRITERQIQFQRWFAEFENDIRNKKYNEALDVAESIPEENDTFYYWRDILKGRAYFELGGYEETLRYLKRYVDADWVDIRIENDAARGMAYTYAGGAYYKMKEYSTALNYLEKCAEIDSYKNIETRVFKGECYIELADYEKAEEAFKEAAGVRKENDNYTGKYIDDKLKLIADKKKAKNITIIGDYTSINNGDGPQYVNNGGQQNINIGGQQVIGDGIINHSNAGNNPVNNGGQQINGDRGFINRSNAGNDSVNIGGQQVIGDGIINRSNAGNVIPQDDAEISICPNCGTKVESGALFCVTCGKELK